MQGIANAEATDRSSGLFGRVRDILLSARVATARSVNSAQVVCNGLIGREIVEDEQSGRRRAAYRERTLNLLAERLKREFGSGYSETNLKGMRTFYLAYPDLIHTPQIRHPLGDEFLSSMIGKRNVPYAPGRISSNLSWRHYRTLMRIDSRDARSFYEIETVKNSWSARELERQVASQLFERLARSRDKEQLMKLAAEGQLAEKPSDVFKDPFIMEFLGLPKTPALTESSVERALEQPASIPAGARQWLRVRRASAACHARWGSLLYRPRLLPFGAEVLCPRRPEGRQAHARRFRTASAVRELLRSRTARTG